jgi:hypothetical protein
VLAAAADTTGGSGMAGLGGAPATQLLRRDELGKILRRCTLLSHAERKLSLAMAACSRRQARP